MDDDVAAGVMEHMNQDHADAVQLYAEYYAGVADASGARLVAMTATGMQIALPNRTERVFVGFEKPVTTPGQARVVLIEMARVARTSQNGTG